MERAATATAIISVRSRNRGNRMTQTPSLRWVLGSTIDIKALFGRQPSRPYWRGLEEDRPEPVHQPEMGGAVLVGHEHHARTLALVEEDHTRRPIVRGKDEPAILLGVILDE